MRKLNYSLFFYILLLASAANGITLFTQSHITNPIEGTDWFINENHVHWTYN